MQWNSKDIIIVIPMYNEEKTIKKTLSLWIETLNILNLDFYIDVYNDGSTDNSAEIVEAISKDCPYVRLNNCKHRGFSATLYEAYTRIRDTKYVFHTDADTEISPKEFEKLWAERKNADLIIGRRINRKQPFHRRIATILSYFIIALLFNNCKIAIDDANVPFRLFKNSLLTDILNTINSECPYPNLFISAYCLEKKLSIIQIDIEYNKKEKTSYLDNFGVLIREEIKSLIALLKYRYKK